MKPIGYNAKTVEQPEDWLGNKSVAEILSVSECISKSPIDHTSLWLFNCRGLYDSRGRLEEALRRSDIRGNTVRIFFFEIEEHWRIDGAWEPIGELPKEVEAPKTQFVLRGYDIVCFTMTDFPECSPLSCNSGAKHFEVNKHCLLVDADRARQVAVQMDDDGGYEPGPYAIVSVWELSKEEGRLP